MTTYFDGTPSGTIRERWLQLDPEGPLGLGKPPGISERNWRILKQTVYGAKLQVIGLGHGITRERVRQIAISTLFRYARWASDMDTALSEGRLVSFCWRETYAAKRRILRAENRGKIPGCWWL